MTCSVCRVIWDDAKGLVCPQCGFDMASPDARDAVKVEQARDAYRSRMTAYNPERISRWDTIKPWLAVILGFGIFLLWLKACGSMMGGRMMRFGRHSYSRNYH